MWFFFFMLRRPPIATLTGHTRSLHDALPIWDRMSPTLFQALLVASFYSLAPAVRALHDVRGRVRYAGRATIARGRNPLGRLCAAVAGLPKAREDVPVTEIGRAHV